MAKKRKSARYEATKTAKGGITQLFMKGSTGIVWAKKFRSNKTAKKAAAGLKSIGHKLVAKRVAKGFKFGAVVKRMNKGRSR